jgi:hypothetical protein
MELKREMARNGSDIGTRLACASFLGAIFALKRTRPRSARLGSKGAQSTSSGVYSALYHGMGYVLL